VPRPDTSAGSSRRIRGRWELRPIIDKQRGRRYASLNPTLDRALRTDRPAPRLEFSPNAAVTFDATGKINLGLEYYGSLGPLGHFDPASQQHQLFRRDESERQPGVGIERRLWPSPHALATAAW